MMHGGSPASKDTAISNWLIIPGRTAAHLTEDALETRFNAALICDQTLASGITLYRRDFRTSARFVFFDTGLDEWRYATHGGTAFVILYKGRNYALTAKHVRQDFNWNQLAITDRKHGKYLAGIRAVYYPSELEGEAVDGDIVDVVLVDFKPDIGVEFFGDEAYVVDAATVATAQIGDPLVVAGALKAESAIDDSHIKPVFCALEFQDNGVDGNDPVLRQAITQFHNPLFKSLTGLSGAPVFNSRSKTLAGMVVRGDLLAENRGIIRYIDIFDISQMIEGVHTGQKSARYAKRVTVLQTEEVNSRTVRP